MKKLLINIFVLLLVSGCAQVQFSRKDNSVPAKAETKFSVSQFFWGYTPLVTPPGANSLCAGSRVESLELKMNTVDVLLSTLTIGFYVPQRVAVVCQ